MNEKNEFDNMPNNGENFIPQKNYDEPEEEPQIMKLDLDQPHSERPVEKSPPPSYTQPIPDIDIPKDRIPERTNLFGKTREKDYAATGYGGQGAVNSSGERTTPPTGFTQGEIPREWNIDDYEQGERQGKKKKNSVKNVFGRVIAACFAVGIIVLAGYGAYSIFNKEAVAPPSEEQPIAIPGLNIQDKPEKENAITSNQMNSAEIITKISPSVVGVANYTAGNSFLPAGEGSGIIMTQDGYIVTNAHVVENAAGITVVLENGDTYAATLIGSDAKTDLAVLKIEATNLTYAEFGNSDKLVRGDSVIAIGNPGGLVLAGSVTGGMVSGLNRTIDNSSPYSTSYIQVDAAINPGNSGGALVNEFGQVVGINSAKIVAEGYEGIGFAIPINEALPIIEEIMKNGYVTGRAELGVTGRVIDQTVAMFRRIPTGFGIESLTDNSDLRKKNVVPGDIITHINGEPIVSLETISNEVAKHKPGESVKLKIFRQSLSGGAGKSFEVDVLLVESSRK